MARHYIAEPASLWLTIFTDLQTMVESIKFNRELLQTEPLSAFIKGESDL